MSKKNPDSQNSSLGIWTIIAVVLLIVCAGLAKTALDLYKDNKATMKSPSQNATVSQTQIPAVVTAQPLTTSDTQFTKSEPQPSPEPTVEPGSPLDNLLNALSDAVISIDQKQSWEYHISDDVYIYSFIFAGMDTEHFLKEFHSDFEQEMIKCNELIKKSFSNIGYNETIVQCDVCTPDDILLLVIQGQEILYCYDGDTANYLKNFVQNDRIYHMNETGFKHGTLSQAHTSSDSIDNKSTGISTGQKNALKTAKSYLDYKGFSYSGLVEILEFEGYTHDEAIYAADHCGANWNEQAARVAKAYLDYRGFSRQRLIELLEFEGFSHSQAVYGVEQNGY